MSIRETWVIRNGRMVLKEDAPPLMLPSHNVMPDIKEFRTQDGVPISSRSHLRAYEQRNGVKQIGTDLNPLMNDLRRKVYGDG